MSTEEIKAKFRWFYEEVFEKGNMDAWDELFSSDFVEHNPPFGDFKGLKAIKEGMKEERRALSDFHATIDEIIIEGNTVVVRHSFECKHTGELMGVPPTGKQLKYSGCVVYHLRNGKVFECFAYEDWLGLFQQLGVIPPLGQGKE